MRISMTNIDKRARLLESDIGRPSMSQPNLRQIENCDKDPITPPVAVKLMNEIASSAANCDAYYGYAFKLLEEQYANSSAVGSFPGMASTMKNSIIPKVSGDNLEALFEQVKDSKLDDYYKTVLEKAIDEYQNIDRMLENHKSIGKRFNLEKVVKGCEVPALFEACIIEACQLIDTYDMSRDAKLNIALEDIQYSIYKTSGLRAIGEAADIITEYFTSTVPITTDKEKRRFKYVLEHNLTLDDKWATDKIAIVEGNSYKYETKIKKLASQCDESANKDYILKAIAVRNEKQASKFITVGINRVSKIDMTDGDRKRIIKAIFMLPLLGYVSMPFVKYEFNKAKMVEDAKNKIEDKDFLKTLDDTFNDDIDEIVENVNNAPEIHMMKLNDFVLEGLNDSTDIFDDIYQEPDMVSLLIESEDFAESKDIKKLIDGFNGEQEKTLGKFKNLMARIYRKSPQNIIDETPNIFGTIRMVFIVGAGIAISPVLSLMLVIVDKLLSMHINAKQAEKLIKAIEKEKDKTEKLISKGGSKKKDLESYSKQLDKCVEKVKAYKDDLVDDDSSDDIELELENTDIFEDDDIRFLQEGFRGFVKNSKLDSIKADFNDEYGHMLKGKSIPGKTLGDKTRTILRNLKKYLKCTAVIGKPSATITSMNGVESLGLVNGYAFYGDKIARYAFRVTGPVKITTLIEVKTTQNTNISGIKNLSNTLKDIEVAGVYCNDKYAMLIISPSHAQKKQLQLFFDRISNDSSMRFKNKAIGNCSITLYNKGVTHESAQLESDEPEINEAMEIFALSQGIIKVTQYDDKSINEQILKMIPEMSQHDIVELLEVSHCCPTVMDYKGISSYLMEAIERNDIRSMDYMYALRDFENSPMNKEIYNEETEMQDLALECFAIEQLEAIHEFSTAGVKLALQNIKAAGKKASMKEKSFWRTLDMYGSAFTKSVERAMTSDRREGIIKGSMIPSFSKCIKTTIVLAGITAINPIFALVTAFGMFAVSKRLNYKERQLIYDEIETELKVVDKEIQLAEAEGDMQKYRFMLQLQKKLEREHQRIKYGLKVHGRDIPSSDL